MHGEALTIEDAADTVAQYRVPFAADGRRLRGVGEARFLATNDVSPRPFLPALPVLDEMDWHPARQLGPYRPRRHRDEDGEHMPLFTLGPEITLG